MAGRKREFLGTGTFQVLFLISVSFVLFWGFYSWDFVHFEPESSADSGHVPESAWEYYFSFDAGSVTDAVSSLSGLIAAVFGIVITVVSIIVQLAANRYAVVTAMFLRDRLNIGVMAYYIVVCVCSVWLSPTLHEAGGGATQFVPRTLLLAVLTMSTIGLAMMAPYFGYVFWFLEPAHIIDRVRKGAQGAARKGIVEHAEQDCFSAQAQVVSAMEELTDITSSSISGKDKIIASRAVDALKDFTLAYLRNKHQAVESKSRWFDLGPALRENPDVVAMDPESLAELEERHTWVEWKVMRQYMGIYNEALLGMSDINYRVAINTRYIGEAAVANKDTQLVKLVFRFMNSYLRATLNRRDVRTAYNVLNQYRLLIESMLLSGDGDSALQGVRYMKYYGHVSFDMKLTFVTETMAYDVAALCELSHQHKLQEEDDMVEEFLELDRPLLTTSQEKGLLGVRKAQTKLACYYLSQGETQRARTIADDMRSEPRERLLTIRSQLESVTSKDFWEIIDRGRNFEFMAEPQRRHLPEFFEWLDIERVSVPDSAPP